MEKSEIEIANERILELEERVKRITSNTMLAVSLPIDLDKVIRIDQPYSLPEVLKALVECADILLHKHGYDGAGWERLEYCYRHGKDIIKLFEGNGGEQE